MKSVTKNEFLNDVQEYKVKEKEVSQSFLLGLIQLGELLKANRDKWKPQELWMDYLNKIGSHISRANQLIRMYEYSQDKANMKILEKLDITNWFKSNSVLSLPDDQKKELAEKIEGKPVTNDEFREKIAEVKGTEIIPNEISNKEIAEFEESHDLDLSEAILSDPAYSASTIIKKMKAKGFTICSLPFIESVIYLGKIKNLVTKESVEKITSKEKKFWADKISVGIRELEVILSELESDL